MITLRPYQQQATTDLREAFRAGAQAVILYSPTGSGKTVMACDVVSRAVQKGSRVLFLGDSSEIIDQTSAALDKWQVPHGIIQGSRGDRRPWLTVHVATIQTLRNRELPPEDLVIVDECFPAGTLIDGRPIETIKPGDRIRTYNQGSKMIETHPVIATSARRPEALVRIWTSDGRSVVCTPNHPFSTPRGYVSAGALKTGDLIHEAIQLRDLRNTVLVEEMEQGHGVRVLRSLSGDSQATTAEESYGTLQNLRKNSDSGGQEIECRSKRRGALLAGMLARNPQTGSSEGRPQDQRIHADDTREVHAGEQPDEAPRGSREGQQNAEGDRLEAEDSRRQRDAHETPDRTCRASGMAGGISRADCSGPHGSLLEVGYCESGSEDRNRSGRREPLRPSDSKAGQGEGARLVGTRVDRVEVLEQTSDGTFGGLCPDGLVYNLQVDENHNYFADGFLVHNCHLCRAATWQAVLEHYRAAGAKLIGLSATPVRLDRKGLGKLFDGLVYCPSIQDLTEQGWLVPVRIFAPPGPNLRDVKTARGDFDNKQLAAAVDKRRLVGDIVAHWLKHARGRLTAVSATSIAHSLHIRDSFREAGIAAEHVDGTVPRTERQRLLAGLPAREYTVLCQVDICGKGWDCPGLECLVDARPTQSLARWLQFVGRGLRIAPDTGKRDCILLDHSGNVHRPGFGMPDEEREWSLDGEEATRTKPKDTVESIRTCRACWFTFRSSQQTCPSCGTPYTSPLRMPEQEAGELQEIARQRKQQAIDAWRAKQTDEGRRRKWDEWITVARERGYRPGFVLAKFKAVFQADPPREWMSEMWARFRASEGRAVNG